MTIYIIDTQKSDGSFPTHRGYYSEPADAIKAVDRMIEYWQQQWAREGSQCFGIGGNYGRMLVSTSGLFIRVQVLAFEDAMAPLDFSNVNPQDEIQAIKGTPDPMPESPPEKRKGRAEK
jgi:hypothetical protein